MMGETYWSVKGERALKLKVFMPCFSIFSKNNDTSASTCFTSQQKRGKQNAKKKKKSFCCFLVSFPCLGGSPFLFPLPLLESLTSSFSSFSILKPSSSSSFQEALHFFLLSFLLPLPLCFIVVVLSASSSFLNPKCPL